MNWLLTLVFYLVLFPHYYLLGNTCLEIFHYEKNVRKSILAGFVTTFFITFIIGFPCQLFYLSWKFYFILQLIVFVLIDGVLIYRNRWKPFINRKTIRNFVRDNWVLILFVVIFMTLAIASQLPYYDLNYDDTYYIGKVMNHVGTPHLMNEDYFNGSLVQASGFDPIRMINTYELSYAFLGTIFHIDLAFLCRISMAMHNYILFAIVYKEIGSYFVSEKYAQYTILPFFYFMLPHGYLQQGMPFGLLRIHSYDLWQFQTAAFYGGSVVRMMSIPILFIFALPLVKKMNVKQLIFMMICSISMLSFSTIFMQVVVLFFVAILLVKFIYHLYEAIQNKSTRGILVYACCVLAMVLFLLATKVLGHSSFVQTEAYLKNVENYKGFQAAWFDIDTLLLRGWIILIVAFLLQKEKKARAFVLVTAILYLFVFKCFFIALLMLTTFGYFFVALRTVASIQYILLFLVGVCFVRLYEMIFHKKAWGMKLVSVGVCICLSVFFVGKQTTFLNYTFLASGVSSAGWNFKRVLDVNTKMVPDIFVEVGDYFNTLPYGNYKMYTCNQFVTDGGYTTYDGGFEMTTNRLHIANHNGFKKLDENDIATLDKFCKDGSVSTGDVLAILNKENIEYILVFNKQAASDLESDGNKLLIKNEQNLNPYYLLRISR